MAHSEPNVTGSETSQHVAASDQGLQAAGDAVAAEGAVAEKQDGQARDSLVAWLFRPNGEPRRVERDEIPKFITVEDNLVWIDLSAYSEDEFREVAEIVHMDDSTVRSALSPWQRPRVFTSSASFSVSVTVAELDAAAGQAVARQLDLLVGKNVLVTAHKQALPFYSELLNRAGTDPDLVRLDSGFMLYIVLDELLAHYESLEEQLRGEVEVMQARALRDSSDAFLEDLLHFKRYAFALGQLAQQHQLVFRAFLRPDFPYISGNELSDHFRDLEDRLLRLVARLEATRQEVNNTFDIYLSHQSHRTNDVMKTLTMVATILFTATFIEGIFGPSFRGVPTHNIAGFIAMLALIGIVTGLALYAFHRRGWM